MQKQQPRLLSLSLRCGLILLVLTPCADVAQAQSSEEYPGPWREITQDVREFLAVHKIYACNEAVGRQSSRNPDECLLYCTRDEKTLDKLARAACRTQIAGSR